MAHIKPSFPLVLGSTRVLQYSTKVSDADGESLSQTALLGMQQVLL